jgi:hypothetical protein
MQPLGRHPVRFPSKEDMHPPRGYVNWWEVEIDSDENKAREKLAYKKQLKKELIDMQKDILETENYFIYDDDGDIVIGINCSGDPLIKISQEQLDAILDSKNKEESIKNILHNRNM